jgi:DNA repair protein RecO (recombination protein O)
MTDRETVQLERGFVLHQRPYRNTSQLVDCLTEHHGVVTLVAHGSRRPQTGQRAVLQPFLALRLSWARRGELGRLTHVEADPPVTPLSGERLLAGFYSNELVLRLAARGDENAEIFSCYSRCLAELSARPGAARTLRLFELRLLEALGYGLGLEHEVGTGEVIRPDGRYRFEPQLGASAQNGSAHGAEIYLGSDLISLREGRLDDEQSLRAAKRLLGHALGVYLGERPLRTRLVLQDVFARGLEP